MSNQQHPVIAQVLAAVQLMTRQPRTCLELANLLGVSRQTASVYMRLMVDEGLVAQSGTKHEAIKGPHAVVYAWVPVEGSC
jgi:DNA-binding IclR family transcriptional regulator